MAEGIQSISWKAQIEDTSKVVVKTTGLARKLTSFIKAVAPTSAKAVRCVSSTKLLAGLPGFFAIYDFVCSIQSSFKERGKRAKTFLDIVDNGKEVVNAAIDMAEGLETIGAVAKKNIAWTLPLAPCLLPFEIITISTAIYDAWGTAKLKEKIDRLPLPQGRGEEGAARAEMALMELESIDTEKNLGKKLKLSPTCSVAAKVESLRSRLRLGEKREAAIEESASLLSTLKARVKKKLTLDILGCSSKIFTTFCAALLVLSPLSPIFLALAALGSIIGTSIFLWQRYSLPAVVPELIKV